MQDLATFVIARAPRRFVGDRSTVITTPGPLPPQHDLVRDALAAPTRQPAARVGTAAAGSSTGTPFEAEIQAIEQWLAQHDDRVSGIALNAKIADAVADFSAGNPGQTWAQALQQRYFDDYGQARDDLAQAPVPFDRLAVVVRDLLVCSLVGAETAYLAKLSPDEVWALLNQRVVPMPHTFQDKDLFPKARIELVRGLAVADLNVIRSEWRRYVPGEIASIRNVMAHETLSEKVERVTESETTTTTESTSSTQTQQETGTTDQSEISRDIASQLQVAIRGQVQTQYETGVPGNRFSVSAGADAGVQIGRSERTASRVAREVVAKAVSVVESTTRESRTARTLARTTSSSEHAFTPSDTNNRGIYRWVDRIDRYQVFTYPNRLQLEFQIPEPATYVRARRDRNKSAKALGGPPPWNVKPGEITPERVLTLASLYRASELPVLPDEKITIQASKSGTTQTEEPMKEPVPPVTHANWTAPTVVVEVEPAIPSGYLATSVEVALAGSPLLRNWHTDKENGGFEDKEAYHTIAATVIVGGESRIVEVTGSKHHAVLEEKTAWANAFLQYSSGQSPFAITPGATGKLTLGAQASGCHTFGASFSVHCERTSEALETWRNQVYDALFAAWSAWNQSWQNRQTQAALLGDLPIGESSPAKNQQTIRDELKRQVISWLQWSSPFPGVDALLPAAQVPPPPPLLAWQDIDLQKALDTAPTIQFLESAFEWQNMAYVFYPYYWAARGRWDELSDIEMSDPDFERFLRAGSARVVVPARPGMELAVRQWLLYQQPFLGLPLPVPGDASYISVAAETNDMTRPPADGYPGESWEVRTGTTLVWLDDSPGLPTNPDGVLGKPPFEPTGTV